MKLSWRIFGGGLIGVLVAAIIVVLAAVVVFGGGDDGDEVTPGGSPSPAAEESDDHDGLTAHDDGHLIGGHDGATGHDDGHVIGDDHDGATGHDDGHTVGGDHDGATAHDDRHEKGDSHDGDTKHDDNHTSFGPSGGGHNGVVSHDDRHEKGDNHDGDTGHDDEHTVGGGHDGATAHDDGHILGSDHDGATAHDDDHLIGGDHDGATAHDDDHTSSTQTAATPEATAEPTLASEQAVDSALAAALEYYDAVSDADCQTNNPQNKQCIGLSSQLSTVQGGIAVFGVASPDGPGFMAVLGLDPSGEWKFWRAGHQDYQLLILPGDALVCAYGSRLNVRSEPTTDAPAVGVLEDLTGARAEEFVLTVPGELQFGYGWFRLSSPLVGWVYSKYLTAAGWGDCALHDDLEPEY